MIMASNSVISGDFLGSPVSVSWKGELTVKGFPLNKYTILSCDFISQSKKKSVASAIGRAAVGGALIGPIVLLAGVTAKSKGTYLVSLTCIEDVSFVLEIDDNIKNILLRSLN